jgi:hypothetical protein
VEPGASNVPVRDVLLVNFLDLIDLYNVSHSLSEEEMNQVPCFVKENIQREVSSVFHVLGFHNWADHLVFLETVQEMFDLVVFGVVDVYENVIGTNKASIAEWIWEVVVWSCSGVNFDGFIDVVVSDDL